MSCSGKIKGFALDTLGGAAGGDSFALFHGSDLFLDKGDFFLVQPVFGVKLAVDLGDCPRPIDVALRREVLKRDF